MYGWIFWAGLVEGLATIIVLAKTHGRLVRLEREREGFYHVDFRAQNPEPVERIWRNDRRVLWSTFAIGASAVVLVVALLRSSPIRPDYAQPDAPLFVIALIGIAFWAFPVAFLSAAIGSFLRARHSSVPEATRISLSRSQREAQRLRSLVWASLSLIALSAQIVLATR